MLGVFIAVVVVVAVEVVVIVVVDVVPLSYEVFVGDRF